MKTSDLLKVVPVAAIALSVCSTSALAGATNRGDNTAATPGPKATTTTTPADGATGREDMRRGTTRTKNMDTPDSASDLERPGSGSAGGTGSDHEDKSMKHDKSSKNKDDSMSGSSGGAGSLDEAGGWDPENAAGQNPVPDIDQRFGVGGWNPDSPE